VFAVVLTAVGVDRESWRDRQTDRAHFGEVCSLATEVGLHGTVAFGDTVSELVNELAWKFSHRHQLGCGSISLRIRSGAIGGMQIDLSCMRMKSSILSHGERFSLTANPDKYTEGASPAGRGRSKKSLMCGSASSDGPILTRSSASRNASGDRA